MPSRSGSTPPARAGLLAFCAADFLPPGLFFLLAFLALALALALLL